MGYHLWDTDVHVLNLRLQTDLPARDGKENSKSLQWFSSQTFLMIFLEIRDSHFGPDLESFHEKGDAFIFF